MVFLIRYIKYRLKKANENRIKRGKLYYKTIHKLPVWNWFKIQKGELNYLWKDETKKHIPNFFYQVVQNMMYEFEYLDLTLARKKALATVYKSMAARLKNKSIEFNAKVIEKEIENEIKKLNDSDSTGIDGFLDFIELTFNNIGGLNPYNISTARAFSLFNKAKKRTEELKRKYEKN